MGNSAKRNNQVCAMGAFMASEKDFNIRVAIEWEIAFNTKPATAKEPNRKVYGQKWFMDNFSRSHGGKCGATKRTHLNHPDGWEFQHIVVKRYKAHGWEAIGEGSGNQMIDEIDCWERFADTPDADFLCPIIKHYKVRSDKCAPLTEKAKDRVVIIAQKAERVSDLRDACEIAERMNREKGYHGESANVRARKLLDMSSRMGWRDVEWNGGNSGVIFDYEKRCYKAVFIDYAL